MRVKVSVRKMRLDTGGKETDEPLNAAALDLRKLRDFLGQEAVRAGFHSGARWVAASRTETTLKLRTYEIEEPDRSLCWIEAQLAWGYGEASVKEVLLALKKA
jgi:hypothetical protein